MLKTRRRSLVCALALLAAAPLFCLQSKPLFAADAGLKIISKWRTGNENIRPVALEGSTLYLSGDKTVEAWNVEGGRLLWRKPLPRPSVFRPRAAGDFLITGGHHLLAAWDKKTGELIWSREPKVISGDSRTFLGAPYYHDGRVYLGEGAQFFALDAMTGKELWSFPTKGGIVGYPAIAYKNDVILFGDGSGFLHALGAKDGKKLWSLDYAGGWQYTRQLHVSGDVMVAGGYLDNLIGVDLAKGEIMWDHYSGNFINSHLVIDDLAYFFSARGWVFAINIKSGGIAWKHKTMDWQKPKDKGNWSMVMSEIAAGGKNLYILDMNDVLRILDKDSGSKLATYVLPFKSRYFMTLIPGSRRILFANLEGEILLAELPS